MNTSAGMEARRVAPAAHSFAKSRISRVRGQVCGYDAGNPARPWAALKIGDFQGKMVLLRRIELPTPSLPRTCSTPELLRLAGGRLMPYAGEVRKGCLLENGKENGPKLEGRRTGGGCRGSGQGAPCPQGAGGAAGGTAPRQSQAPQGAAAGTGGAAGRRSGGGARRGRELSPAPPLRTYRPFRGAVIEGAPHDRPSQPHDRHARTKRPWRSCPTTGSASRPSRRG